MIALNDTKTASFRKTHQGYTLLTTSVSSASSNSTSHLNLTKREINEPNLSKLSCRRRYRLLTGKIISITIALLVFVGVVPRGILSAPSTIQNENSLTSLKQKASSSSGITDSVLSDFVDLYHENEPYQTLDEGSRMKREVYADDDDEATDEFFNANEDSMDMRKRSSYGNNNRARRVSMMRLKKTPLYWQYPKRMSMMRLRRQYLPSYDNIRATRGMGNVSMLRLRRGNVLPSLMRLKKMTQMRLKRMTQMRLKKSGMPQFEDSDEDDLVTLASENKRDAEETFPVIHESEQD